LGPVIYESFKRAKCAEVDEYRTRVTDWEVSRYLETT
jgi:glutamine synthetase